MGDQFVCVDGQAFCHSPFPSRTAAKMLDVFSSWGIRPQWFGNCRSWELPAQRKWVIRSMCCAVSSRELSGLEWKAGLAQCGSSLQMQTWGAFNHSNLVANLVENRGYLFIGSPVWWFFPWQDLRWRFIFTYFLFWPACCPSYFWKLTFYKVKLKYWHSAPAEGKKCGMV